MNVIEWLRPPAAARHLGVSQSYLAKLRMAGTGPRYSKSTRVVAYKRSDLDVWLESQSLTSTSEKAPVSATPADSRRWPRRA